MTNARATFAMVMLGISSLFFACGGGFESGGGAGGEQVALQQPPAQTSGGSGSSAFVISNQSSNTICYVYVSTNNDPNWGPDRLGSSETIPPAAQRAWNIEPGVWDMKFEDCQHHPVFERRGVPIQGAGVMVTVR